MAAASHPKLFAWQLRLQRGAAIYIFQREIFVLDICYERLNI